MNELDELRQRHREIGKAIALKEKQEAGRKLRAQFKRLATSGPEDALFDEVNRVLDRHAAKGTDAGTLAYALSKAFDEGH